MLENVCIPINLSRLWTLRMLYPTSNVGQNLLKQRNRTKRSSASEITNDKAAAFNLTSDSSVSIPVMATNIPSYQGYFSKIDQ